MDTWGTFARREPELAARGRTLLYQFGVGLAFLATVTVDGGPRVHPMCPLLTDASMFGFIVPSPKQRDLRRDGRYAMHSFPCEANEDAFYVVGRAVSVDDGPTRSSLADQFVAERSQLAVPLPADTHLLFEFLIERCMATTTTGHGDPDPQHLVACSGPLNERHDF